METEQEIFFISTEDLESFVDVPAFYYHVSEECLRDRILSEGLLEHDPEPTRVSKGVYLWDNLESAQSWMNIHSKEETDLEIWEVSSDGLAEDLIEYDEYGSGITCGAYAYRANIDSANLRLL